MLKEVERVEPRSRRKPLRNGMRLIVWVGLMAGVKVTAEVEDFVPVPVHMADPTAKLDSDADTVKYVI